jgi:hypothetical protein
MELNTSQPQHSQIIAKPSRNPILLIISGVILIVIVALVLLLWQKNQEIGSVLDQLADTEKQLVAKNTSKKDDGNASEQPAMYKRSDAEQKTAASLAATEYYCLVTNFGCDKVTSTVTKFQKVTQDVDGFAIVKATNTSEKTVTAWLKYRSGGTQWVVIYEGDSMPSSAVIKQFDIPTDFVAVN